jgi:pyridoxal phosphate enzyme (YggS family)
MDAMGATDTTDTTDTMAKRAAEVRGRVDAAAERSGRAAADITLVAVSKTVPIEGIVAAHGLGFGTFGENRVQEAQEKIAALSGLVLRWELIGHLQTNKAARAVDLFERVQSVDSLRVAEALNGHAATRGRVLPVLLEVNVAGEATKSGFTPDALVEAARAIAGLEHLRPQGLMTVAPLTERPEDVRPVFRRLRALRDDLRARVAQDGAEGGWHELSMGMSDDYDVAIEEGATIVRIGRALFGARPTT